MANLIRTTRTYATAANAEKALAKIVVPRRLEDVRYLIAVSHLDGRFAPVLVGVEYLPFIHHGVTVVG